MKIIFEDTSLKPEKKVFYIYICLYLTVGIPCVGTDLHWHPFPLPEGKTIFCSVNLWAVSAFKAFTYLEVSICLSLFFPLPPFPHLPLFLKDVFTEHGEIYRDFLVLFSVLILKLLF